MVINRDNPINIREDFPLLNSIKDGKPLIYLDNAATTQKPQSVIDAVTRFYREENANVHRSVYGLAEIATSLYENTRKKAAAFIHASDSRSIIFTSGTTESINLVAHSWGRKNLKPGDEILITHMEHHSNIIPWQLAAKDTGAVIKAIPLKKDGTLDLSEPEKWFTKKTKIVAVVYQSNVLGTINPIKQIIEYSKNVGAVTLIDAAQTAAHSEISVEDLNCDFLAFSGHKMLGPTGVGVLYGKPELLEAMDPFMGGGEMIDFVGIDTATWNDIPYKFEAGTPQIAQVVGLSAAFDYILKLGFKNIESIMENLLDYALDQMRVIKNLKIYGPSQNRGAVISFNVDNIHPQDLAQFLDLENIAIRTGHHCAQPIMKSLGINSAARASLYFYNTRKEIDTFCARLEKVKTFF